MIILLFACAAPPPPAQPLPADDTGTAAPDTADSAVPPDTADSADSAGDTDTGEDTAPSGTDADGDGASVEAGDCDDGNPYVFPGAEEWCDPTDHDCDGAPLAEGVCGKQQDVLALWTTSWTPPAEWADDGTYVQLYAATFAGDLDGDGRSEVAASCDNCSSWVTGTGGSSVWLFPGGVEGRDLDPTAVATAWWMSREGYLGMLDGLGDWNGDGVPDIALVTGDDGYQEGAVRILYGPSSRWGMGDDATAAADVLVSSEGEYLFGSGIKAADLDDDGMGDIVLGALPNGWGSPSVLHALRGRTETGLFGVSGEPSLSLPDDIVNLDTFVPGDLDGDGSDEVIVLLWDEAQWTVEVVSGPDLATGSGEPIGEVARESWAYTGVPAYCFASPGDLDGDGLPDWVFGQNASTSRDPDPGRIYAITGVDPSRQGVSFEEGAAGWWSGSEERAIGFATFGCTFGDFDGSGSRDLMLAQWDFNAPYGDFAFSWSLIRGPLGVPAANEEPPSGLQMSTSDYLTLYPDPLAGPADFDGDGTDDLLFGEYHRLEADGMGGSVLIPGWSIPWDDPTYW